MNDLLTIAEAAAAARRSKRTILNWLAGELLQAVTLPSGARLIVAASLFNGPGRYPGPAEQRTAPARASNRQQIVRRREEAHQAVLDAANAGR